MVFLSEQQQEAILSAIEEAEQTKLVPHETVIEKHKKTCQMRYKVKWTLSAENDFDLITDYLLDNWSASVLQKFIEITEASIQQILRFPTLFPIIYKKERVRKCVLTKQNTLYYKIKDSEIQILRIFDTRQNPSKLQF